MRREKHGSVTLEKVRSQGIDQNSGNDNQVSDKLSRCDFLLQKKTGEKKDKYIGKSVNHGAVLIGNTGIGVGVQKQYAEKDGISRKNAPVQILVNTAFMFRICALFQQNL